jgi:hypothetical protein
MTGIETTPELEGEDFAGGLSDEALDQGAPRSCVGFSVGGCAE